MIAPQTDVYLLNTPLHSDGVNTLTWSSETRQYNYFYSRRVFTLTNFYYQRKDFALKVEIPVDELYGKIDYMMYRNNAYTNKWFYAFIDDIVYVNDTTSLIYIRTDEFQTWYFDIQFNPCFVVREHTNDDTIGANRTDEGLGLGDYVCVKKETMWSTQDPPRIAILEGVNQQTSTNVDAHVSTSSGISSDVDLLTYFIVNATMLVNATGWRTGVVGIVGGQDPGVVGLVWYSSGSDPSQPSAEPVYVRYPAYLDIYGITPRAGVDMDTWNKALVWCDLSVTEREGTITTYSQVSYLNNNVFGYNFRQGPLHTNTVDEWLQYLSDFSLVDDIGALYLIPPVTTPQTSNGSLASKGTKTFTTVRNVNGYVPKNNKLFCFPYTTVKVHNGSDSNRVLRPELFYTYGTCSFEYWCDFAPSCSMVGVPLNYAGVAESLEYSINSAKYPLSSGAYDAYKNYLGIHSAERNIRIFGGIVSSAMSIVPFLAGGVGTAGEIGDLFYSQSKGKTTSQSNASRSGYTNGRRFSSHSMSEFENGNLSVSGGTMSTYQALRGVGTPAIALAGILAEENAKRNERYTTVGSISNSNLNAANLINIFIEQQTITYDYAKRIDDFFSMYGYKTNQLKTPNITGRLNWNYVQVANANITGAIPNDSMDRIRAMLESGVTFWHNPSTYMDYSQANTIVP